MREITSEAKFYFASNKKFKKSNTEVKVTEDLTALYLFGNLIAIKDRNTGEVKFTLAGWNSVTTRERLKAIGVQISSRQGIPYYNGKQIDCYGWNIKEVA